MDSRIPIAARLTVRDDPPAETKGSVIPVTGTTATTTPMLMSAWKHIQAVMPAAINPPKVSGARMAVRMPAYASAAKRPITTAPPTSPSSWAMTEKIKSLMSQGTATGLFPRPVPKSPPALIAWRPWTVW